MTNGKRRLAGMVWLIPVVVTAALVFFPVWNPAQHDVAGLFDVFSQFVASNYYFDASLRAGDFPTWNPLLLSGMPHAA